MPHWSKLHPHQSLCGCVYLLHVKQMCIPLMGDTQKDCERKRKREVWGWGSLRRRLQQERYYCSSNPHLSLIPPPTYILIKSSSQCLYVWQTGCLSILLSNSHHELLSQAFAQIHLLYFWVCQISASFFFLRLKDCLLVQGTMSDKFSAHIYTQHANAL